MMRPAENIEELINRLRVEPRAEMSKRNLDDALAAHKKVIGSVSSRPTIWRAIMKSRTGKIAAVVMIIVSVAAGIHFLGGSTESVAWADVVRPILTARTVVFNVEGENIPTTKVMNMGTQRVRAEVLSADGKTVQVVVIDYDASRMLTLIPNQKKAVRGCDPARRVREFQRVGDAHRRRA